MRSMIALPALLFFAVPAQAQWAPPDEVLQVHAKGEGAWVVNCQWQSRRGQPMTREIRGSGRDRWERMNVLEPGGTCYYQAAPDRPLTIRMRSPLYRCALPAPVSGACEQTFPAGASGQLDVRPRS